MAQEDGEFELILGNKQLLSVLFIIIVLLGVFFAMGFLAGRSTSPTLAGSPKPAGGPLVVEPESKSAATPDAAKGLAPGEVAKAAPREEPETKAPAREAAAEPPKETAKAAPPKPEPPKPEPAKAEPPKPAPGKPAGRPAPAGVFVETPPSGTYIQVAATRRPDAETLIGQLGRQGMSGYITPSPKSPDLMRVIVGPLGEAKEIADAREKLKGLGIANGIIVKYK
jgi:cell division septation protein DedD